MSSNGSSVSAVRHRIAVDAMGGDHAPREVVHGALMAAGQYPVELILVGREETIRSEALRFASALPENITIRDAREVVAMDDTAITALRTKRNSSVRVAASLVAEGAAQAFVSAGNTGAAWTAAKKEMGMIEGVARPALAAIVPRTGGYTLILDVGASVDSKPHHLREFAVMGHFYAQLVFGIEAPRVGLLSIGEEEGKGNELTRQTFRVLKETGLNFVGNAEGRDIYNGSADVIICDGFIGNVVLKASEALGEMVTRSLREELEKNAARKLGAALTRPAFKALRRRMDYTEYGGAPLLGVNGGCIICHGRSTAPAIKNAIRVAAEFADHNLNAKIERELKQTPAEA